MGPNGEEMETAVIITTAATGELARLHERTPVIVPPDAFDLWLDCGKVDALTGAGAAGAQEGRAAAVAVLILLCGEATGAVYNTLPGLRMPLGSSVRLSVRIRSYATGSFTL